MVLAQARPGPVMEALAAIYEIQDSRMYNQIEDDYPASQRARRFCKSAHTE